MNNASVVEKLQKTKIGMLSSLHYHENGNISEYLKQRSVKQFALHRYY